MTALANAPAHWTRTTIGEIADVRLGRQRSPKDHAGDQMRPYLRAANVNWYSLRLKDVAEMNFTDDEMQRYALAVGDVLVVEGSGSAAEVGKCVVVPEGYEGHGFQNTLIRLRPNKGIDPRWLMYRVNAEAELGGFLRLARGSGIFHLGSTRTAKWPVAVPPLDEQQRIVAEVERLEARLGVSQGLLSAALERISLAEQVTADDLIYGASRRRLSDLLAEPIRNGKSVPDGTGRPVLRLTALREDVVNLREHKLGEWGGIDPDDFSVVEGDRLLVRGNGTLGLVGRSARVPSVETPVAFPDTAMRVRLNRDVITPEYFDEVWRSVCVRRQIEDAARTTSGIYKVNQAAIGQIEVPLVPRSEQAAVAAIALSRRTALGRARRTLRLTRARTLDLRRSILKAAFEGRL